MKVEHTEEGLLITSKIENISPLKMAEIIPNAIISFDLSAKKNRGMNNIVNAITNKLDRISSLTKYSIGSDLTNMLKPLCMYVFSARENLENEFTIALKDSSVHLLSIALSVFIDALKEKDRELEKQKATIESLMAALKKEKGEENEAD